MTNFEYYKETILEIINDGSSLGVYKGKPVKCTSIECSECISSNDEHGCDKGIYNWLYEEYVEQPKQPKLTKKERQFCELVERGWICRSKYKDMLSWFESKPEKLNEIWTSHCIMSSIALDILNLDFSFITWDDAEPWSVEDLLKLEEE